MTERFHLFARAAAGDPQAKAEAGSSDVIRATLLLVKQAALKGELTDDALLQIERAVRLEFGGDVHYVGKGVDKEVRNAAILEELRKGIPKGEVARRHGLSKRHVGNIAKKS